MTVITFNRFGSKFHLLVTYSVFQTWTEDGSPWCTVYDKTVHSSDEDPVPQSGDNQRNLWWHINYITL